MFEQASRKKLRFDTVAGNITVEDLWDLPLTSVSGASLDTLAKSLNKAVKESDEESFVVKKTTLNEVLDLKFSIVKHVIEVRLEEIEQKENAAARKAKKEMIMGIIADKQNDKLKNTSIKKLEEMVAEL